MKFFRGIMLGALLSIPLWFLIAWFTMAHADEPARVPPTKLAGWVHVIGCPHSSEKITGPNNVVLWFDNGESVSLDLNKLDEKKRDDLKAAIGDVQGYTFVAKCEMAT
jgi:hypothetical protein